MPNFIHRFYFIFYVISANHRRGKRSIYRDIKRTISQIQRGIENILYGYTYNLTKGIRKIVATAKSIEKVVSDVIDDIDNRLNRSGYDSFFHEDEEGDEDSEDNVLINYCFGPINGPNYGVRTLITYEEQCEEGTTCAEDITPSADGSETENANVFNDRGNIYR